MGLGTKIKDALAGEPHESTYEESKPPGAFPEDGSGRHTDGRQVVPLHGSAVPGTGKTGTTGMTGPTSNYDEQRYESGAGTGAHSHHGRGAAGATSTGASLPESESRQHRLHKTDDPRAFEDSREYSRANDNYMNPPREKAAYEPGHTHRDSGVDLNRASNKDHPYWGDVENGQRRHHGATEGIAAGAGAAGAGYGASSLGGRDLPERTRHGHNSHGHGLGSKNDELHPSGEAVGGGVYNTVTGAGSPEQAGQHTGHHGQSSHPGPESRTSGTTGGIGGPTPGYSDTRYDPKNGTRDSIPTSRDDRTAPGVVGAGAGAGAGVGAGLAASELSRRHHEKDLAEYDTPPNHHGRDKHEPGMPHSSMLDPYTAKDHSRTAPNETTGLGSSTLRNTKDNSRLGTGPENIPHQVPESSRFENAPGSGIGPTSGTSKFDHERQSEMPPIGETSGFGSGHPSHTGAVGENSRFDHQHGSGTGPAAGTGAGSALESGMGKSHYGPAHEGAKVMHTCHSCGADNDISHYFKKDAVYRIGS